MSKKISGGVVHSLPKDLEQMLSSSAKLKEVWEDITPLARNEFICWVTSAKQEKTRTRRIEIAKDKLNKGFTLAFLVTANFEIHIGTTAMHKDIYTHFPYGTAIMEKGKISGSAKKIFWEVSDSQKDIEVKSSDLAKLQLAIKQKINDTLDLDYYLQ
jgi:hypothetical protein